MRQGCFSILNMAIWSLLRSHAEATGVAQISDRGNTYAAKQSIDLLTKKKKNKEKRKLGPPRYCSSNFKDNTAPHCIPPPLQPWQSPIYEHPHATQTNSFRPPSTPAPIQLCLRELLF